MLTPHTSTMIATPARLAVQGAMNSRVFRSTRMFPQVAAGGGPGLNSEFVIGVECQLRAPSRVAWLPIRLSKARGDKFLCISSGKKVGVDIDSAGLVAGISVALLSRLRHPANPLVVQTAFFSFGDALNRTALLAFTLIFSPVRGFMAFRAFSFVTVNVPKPGRVNFPVFLSWPTSPSMTAFVALVAALLVRSRDPWRTLAINAFDIRNPYR
jgi:hypothetical protein